jgi:ABC-2 type transport system permease protein
VSQAAEPSGRVFDLGYRHYDGPREGRKRAVWAVYKDGLRAAAGLGRGGRAKVVPWLFVAAALIPALVMALVAGAVDRLAPGFNASTSLPSFSDYYAIASIVLLVFGALVGSELFCTDRRTRAISLYLVRPLKATDYAAARWGALVTVMLVAAWLPQFVLATGLVLGAPDPGGYLGDHWADIPRFLLSGALLAVWVSTLGALIASFTTRRAYATAFLVGIFILSAAVVGGATSALSSGAARWVGLLSIRSVPLFLNDRIFGVRPGDGPFQAELLPWGVLVLWYLLVVCSAAAVVLWRYRRLSV